MEVSSLWFNTQFTIGKIPHVWKLKNLEGKILRPKVVIDFENEFYQVKTVNHIEELLQVLSLRFEVFFREFSTQKVSFSIFPYDVDVYDFTCDHLIVKDKRQNKVIACYRLLSSIHKTEAKQFYSQSEFNIAELLKLEGNKLEIGRACVDKEYRKGTVISLLWKGLLEYARKSDTHYMFGCSSINRSEFSSFQQTMDYLEEKNCLINDLKIEVLPEFQMKLRLKFSNDCEERPINSLMHMYLLAGAKIGRNAAYDREMDCLDLFTLVNMKELPAAFSRRFS